MSAKDLIIDFINFIFLIAIVGLTIIYIIGGDNLAFFKTLMESLAPFGGLGIIFLINFKIWREKAKKKEREGNLDITLRLTFFDKLKSNLFLFLLPIGLLLIAFIVNGKVGLLDISEAAVIFVLAYFWQRWLFGKERQ